MNVFVLFHIDTAKILYDYATELRSKNYFSSIHRFLINCLIIRCKKIAKNPEKMHLRKYIA